MKVVSSGNKYEIYDDSLKIYDNLPAKTYALRFSKMTGFYLETFNEIEVKENKVYGVHTKKVEKVIRTFKDNTFNRNLGVMLSGHKGIGKSLFAKMLSKEAIKNGIPVIIVDTYYNGIASFIAEINQEVVVLFDEFDKTFGSTNNNRDTENDPQVEMLTLFDGVVGGNKKMFIITCNEIYHLNDYLVNRPGRFHYHFRFEYPTPDEIKEYLQDKLNENYYDEIHKVISFSRKVNLTYDCLRAIAFELNNGEKFEEAIKDLNIINTNRERYNVTLYFTNGLPHKAYDTTLDFFSTDDEDETVYLYNKEGENNIDVSFNYKDCKTNMIDGSITIDKNNLHISYVEDSKGIEETKKLIVDYLSITKCKEKNLHYVL